MPNNMRFESDMYLHAAVLVACSCGYIDTRASIFAGKLQVFVLLFSLFFVLICGFWCLCVALEKLLIMCSTLEFTTYSRLMGLTSNEYVWLLRIMEICCLDNLFSPTWAGLGFPPATLTITKCKQPFKLFAIPQTHKRYKAISDRNCQFIIFFPDAGQR